MSKPFLTVGGSWRFEYKDKEGRRRTFSLGRKYDMRFCEKLQGLVGKIVTCQRVGEPVGSLIEREVGNLPAKLQTTFEHHGLVTLHHFRVTLSAMVGEYMESKRHLLMATQTRIRGLLGYLLRCFGGDFMVSKIGIKEVERFHIYVCSLGFSPTTVHRIWKEVRSLFLYGERFGYVNRSPFRDTRAGNETNEKARFFVSREMVLRALPHCERAEDRFIMVLARFGGLRIWSEVKGLRIEDFHGDYFELPSSGKTGSRQVPLFPEIRTEFEKLRGKRKTGLLIPDEYFTSTIHYRITSAVRSSGQEVWPKLFVNMRSSVITEYLESGVSSGTLDAIFGNSSGVRKKYYLQFRRKEEFERVLGISFVGTPSVAAALPVVKTVSERIELCSGIIRSSLSDVGFDVSGLSENRLQEMVLQFMSQRCIQQAN